MPSWQRLFAAILLGFSMLVAEVALLKTPFELPSFYLGALANKVVNAVLDRTKLRPIEEREDWRITQAIFEAAKRESMEAGAEFLLVDISFGPY